MDIPHRTHLKLVEDVCGEDEQLHPCQILAQTTSFPHPEGDLLIHSLQLPIEVKEARGVKSLWITEDLLVVKDGGDLRDDASSLGNEEAVDVDVAGGSMD